MKKVGLSLSQCIKDLTEGTVDCRDVAFIITHTKVRNEDDLRKVIETYSESAWFKRQAAATYYVWLLWGNGKIVQPRIHGIPHPYPQWRSTDSVGGKSWTTTDDPVVKSFMRARLKSPAHNVRPPAERITTNLFENPLKHPYDGALAAQPTSHGQPFEDTEEFNKLRQQNTILQRENAFLKRQVEQLAIQYVWRMAL